MTLYCTADIPGYVDGCNCAGPAPGYPQHEAFCGQDMVPCGAELDEDGLCTEHDHVEEEILAGCYG